MLQDGLEHLIKVVQEVEPHASNDHVHCWHHNDPLPQQPVSVEGPCWCSCIARHTLTRSFTSMC